MKAGQSMYLGPFKPSLRVNSTGIGQGKRVLKRRKTNVLNIHQKEHEEGLIVFFKIVFGIRETDKKRKEICSFYREENK